MTPPADTAVTEVELEVARILRKLPKLVLDADARRLPDFLRWGTRRRRSALGDDDSLPLLPPPPPAPPISPPPDGNDERKDGTRSGGATSSPATPLSFPASGSEEPDSRPPRPPSSSSVKAFKNPKRHKEWVKEQSQLIASLSNQKVLLQRSVEEYNALYRKLKARNSWLRDLKSKEVRAAMQEVGQRRTQRQDGSFEPAPLGPTSVQSPAARSMVEPHHLTSWWEVGRAVQPPSVDRTSVEASPAPAPARRECGAPFDLNARPEEEKLGNGEEWDPLQSTAYKAAMSAQARKRRLEIQREKNSYTSSSTFFRLHKMPRLR